MAAVKAAVDGMDKISTKQLEFAKDKLLMGTERKSMALTEESRKVVHFVYFLLSLKGCWSCFLVIQESLKAWHQTHLKFSHWADC